MFNFKTNKKYLLFVLIIVSVFIILFTSVSQKTKGSMMAGGIIAFLMSSKNNKDSQERKTGYYDCQGNWHKGQEDKNIPDINISFRKNSKPYDPPSSKT